MVNCDELLEEFELQWARKINGIRIVTNSNGQKELQFQLLFKSGDTREISPAGAIAKWPKLVMEFFEKVLVMVKQPRASDADDIVEEAIRPSGDPIRILCENIFLIIHYLFVA